MNDFLRRLLFLPEQSSTLAGEIDRLHYFVIILTMLGATLVAIVTLFYIIKYRASKHRGDDAVDRVPVPQHGIAAWVELSVFAVLLSLFIIWWVIGYRQYARISDVPPNALPIYVTGKQWMWAFAYPNGAGSNGTLYVPANRPVKLVLTSRDVIHSFFVPSFRVKRDAVPGRATTLWFEATHPGRFPLYCTEYCGADHSRMLGEVIALPEDQYRRMIDDLGPVELTTEFSARLVGERPTELVSLAAVGERVSAEKGCFRCHTGDGTPHIGPTWAGLYQTRIELADGRSIVADEAYLTRSMMDPGVELHRGFLNVMPTYQGQLTAGEVGAIVEYIRSLRDVPRQQIAVPLPTETKNVPLVTPLPGGSR